MEWLQMQAYKNTITYQAIFAYLNYRCLFNELIVDYFERELLSCQSIWLELWNCEGEGCSKLSCKEYSERIGWMGSSWMFEEFGYILSWWSSIKFDG